MSSFPPFPKVGLWHWISWDVWLFLGLVIWRYFKIQYFRNTPNISVHIRWEKTDEVSPCHMFSSLCEQRQLTIHASTTVLTLISVIIFPIWCSVLLWCMRNPLCTTRFTPPSCFLSMLCKLMPCFNPPPRAPPAYLGNNQFYILQATSWFIGQMGVSQRKLSNVKF